MLTRRLLAAGASVLAVELDPRLAAYLRRELAGVPGFDLIEADALSLHPRDCFPGEEFKLVANIPYHITSPLLHAFLEGERPPQLTVLLVQAEVAERVAAPPGQMSYLSVFVQYHARVRIAAQVPAAAFEPEPAVDSAVLVLEPFPEDDRLPDAAAEDELWRLVQAGFRERRKMLHNVLSRQLPIPPAAVAAALAATGIAPDRRPQTLGVGEWLALREAIGPVGPDNRGRRREKSSRADESERDDPEATG